ncbi:glycosyltransferase family 4 protein [Pseudotamlana carrageenivorans]|uniref:Uncharacterized protein n=1 Tax=Pseudotamlana carrageenivorans TaxID=2069432 RepID=A0A2I7SIV7_9FLAO|nr:glycosyltransferase family 4 protein [Tamlana carrageenivorans]AUS05840.1 hypothetical protein C1A40_10370 [Tamlana carrageenivorans]
MQKHNHKMITVVVNGKFHAFDYAAELYKKGLLDKLISTMPYSIAKKYGIPRKHYIGLPIFEVVKRSYRMLLKKELPVNGYANLFTKSVIPFIPKTSNVIISFAGYSKEIFEHSKFKNVTKILDRGSTHTLENIKLKQQAGEFHNFKYAKHPETFIEREIGEYNSADYILIPSSFVKRTFTKHGINNNKLIKIPYAFSTSRFKHINISKQRLTNKILFVGQLSPRKGTGVLIQAIKEVQKEIPNIELWLVGALQKGIDQSLLDEHFIKYFGILRGQKLIEKYQEASLFCLPSFEEGLALVLTEAKYFNLPIIATPNTGIEDLVDIDNIKYQLFEAGNPLDLASKIKQSLKTTHESFQIKSINHTWKDFTNQLISEIQCH